MAFIKQTQLDALNQKLMSVYNEFLKNRPSSVGSLVSNQSTGGRKQFVHAFNTGVPIEREWNGERVVKSIQNKEITGTTTKYEVTVGVDVEDVLSDILGPYVSKFAQLGSRTSRFLDRRVASFLAGGSTLDSVNANYDDLALFSASHVTNNGTANSNLLTSTALTYANLQTAIETMLGMLDDQDVPLMLQPKYLIVPTALSETARELMSASLLNDGDTNTLKGRLEVVHLPELDNETVSSGAAATNWYIAAGDMPVFVNHELASPELVALNSQTDANVFFDDQVVYGWTARSRLLAGPYQNLLKCEA